MTTKRLGPALVADGLFSTSVLVPEDFWNEASQVVKIGVLRHELAHWKRRDVVFSTAARAVRALHWFNPAAFWAVRRFDEAIENRCDELAFGGDVGAARFVEAILATAESREIYSVLQKKFGGSAFLRRARNLQRLNARNAPMLKRTITLCVAIPGWKIGGGNDKKPGESDSIAAAEIASETAPRPNENDAETPQKKPFSPERSSTRTKTRSTARPFRRFKTRSDAARRKRRSSRRRTKTATERDRQRLVGLTSKTERDGTKIRRRADRDKPISLRDALSRRVDGETLEIVAPTRDAN